jgi:predicted HTH transcriptional regulator
MNSEGGELLIGVEDDGTISGIENDYQTLTNRKNWDGWSQHLVNIIRERFRLLASSKRSLI